MDPLPPPARAVVPETPSPRPSTALALARGEDDALRPLAGPDLRLLLRVLAGRRKLILVIIALASTAVGVGVALLSDTYTAEALLLADNRRIQIVHDTEAMLSGTTSEDTAIQSEIELLRSDQVLRAVSDRLGLEREPEFIAPEAASPDAPPGERALGERALGLLAQAAAWLPAPLDHTLTAPVAALAARLESERAARTGAGPGAIDQVLERLRRKLEVGIVGRSRVIRVRYTAKRPELSAAIVNAVVGHYMDSRRAMGRTQTDSAIAWLNERIPRLREEAEQTERAAERYRFQAGLTKGQTGTLAAQQLEQTRARLAEASANRARLVAQAEALRRPDGGQGVGGDSLASPVVAQLRAQMATLDGEVAQLSGQYGPRHPRLMEIEARRGRIAAAIQGEVQREISGVREAAAIAIAQENALKEMVDRLEGRYAERVGDQGVKLNALEAEATAKRQLLGTLMARLEEVQAQNDPNTLPTGVKLVSMAKEPSEPSGPPRALLFAAGVLGSGLLSVVLVFALELVERRVRSPDALRRTLGTPGVHIVPHHPIRKREGELRAVFQRHPFSPFAESLRTLYRNHLADLGPVGSLAVTSARAGDGKTSLSLAIAQTASQAGRRVVVVDTDFRRPRLDQIFKLTAKPGLAEWIAGEAALDDIVTEIDDTPFAVIPAGRLSATALDRFNIDSLVDLMAGLSPHFDLVIFDTAPALAISDARVVAGVAARVVFVARWGHTTGADLQAIADLGAIDHSRFITVLTDVDLKKAAQHGYTVASYLSARAAP